MPSPETKIGGKKIGKIKLGDPEPIEKFRPLPRRLPQHDWPAVLNSVPLGSYVDLRREDGTPWTWATVYFAIKRLVKQGVIQNGEFKVRTHKLSSGQEATLLFHYGKLNPKPRNTTPSSPSIRSRRDIKSRISNSSYEEGLSKVLALLELQSNRLRELETVIDQVQKNKKVESMPPPSN